MGNPQWMGGSQYKGELLSSHADIETFIKNRQKRLYAHDNRITGEGFRMGEFAYASFGYLNYDVLK